MGLTKGYIIHVDGNIKPVCVNDYKDIQTVVGGFFDVVCSESGETSFWVNDEGKLNGMKPNVAATKILWRLNPAFDGQDYLAGPVLITGGADENGETLDVGSEALTAIGIIPAGTDYFDSIGL